jgi:hypothetical protein
MVLTKGQAFLVLSTYKSFCNAFERDGNITDKNFNRILQINSYLNGKKDDVRAGMGNRFDEIYALLETPEIKSRLEKKKKIAKSIKVNKKHKKQKCSSKPASNEIIYIISQGLIKNVNPGGIPVPAIKPHKYKEPTTRDWGHE